MSHPHDGCRSESGVNFGGSDQYYYAKSGDESNSISSYIDLNWDFSQFDRGNMNRYLTSISINEASAVLEMIMASPRSGRVSSDLAAADAQAASALSDFAAMNYVSAAMHAKSA